MNFLKDTGISSAIALMNKLAAVFIQTLKDLKIKAIALLEKTYCSVESVD